MRATPTALAMCGGDGAHRLRIVAIRQVLVSSPNVTQ